MQTDQSNTQGRLFLALFLSLAIWMGINYFFFPPKPLPPKQTTTIPTEAEKEIATSSKEVKKQSESIPAPKENLNPVNPKEIKTFSIKTESFLVSFSSLGGRISKFYIKNHKEVDGSVLQIVKAPKFKVDFDGESFLAVELSRFEGFDFNLIDSKNEIPNSNFNQVNFESSFNPETNTVVFTGIAPDGTYRVKKTFQFFPTENYFKFNLEIINPTKNTVELSSSEKDIYLRSFGSLGPILKERKDFNERDSAHYFRYFYLDGSFKDFIDSTTTVGFFDSMFGSNDGKDTRFEIRHGIDQNLDFVGSGSRYFIAVLDPLDHNPTGVILDNRKGNETGVLISYKDWKLGPGETKKFDFAAYVGVRELDGTAFRNKELDPNQNPSSPFKGLSSALDKSFNQGLTTPLRNGIVWILKKIYLVIPNYGWAIVIFAILFKLVFYPLNKKQAESMKKMQELSPQIKALNEKYEDPKVRQEKTIELYRKHGTNPMSGCLPMLVQIPIFIALYTAFSDTVELWNSEFLWIHDLSEPDTVFTTPMIPIIGSFGLNILPLIMVASQIMQSRMTTVPTDPNQKMMMYMMPVIMLYFFWSMPSGVTMYWTMQNFLSIAQQYYTNKYGKSDKDKKNSASTSVAANEISSTTPKKGFRESPTQRKKKKK
jgi:YidC/Oxa1 family membrane protein insertase